jgi:type I restriction enzyme S subunit
MIEISNLTEAIEKKMDRSKWKKYKFSDLVENIVEKVVPKNSGLQYYIGLEHLDSGSLKIKRFGETASLIGDKLKIYKGDLIFAKRNSYLKRVAIADFDAVASAHSMVLRPKSKIVDPKFFPFFMMSEIFWKRAIEISVGSLSPTINWKSLAKQEFLLPPKDQQAQLAELLWAMDEVIESKINVLDKLNTSYDLFVNDLFDKLKKNWMFKPLHSVSKINKQSLKSSHDPNYEFKYLDIAGIVEPKVIGTLNAMKLKDAPGRARRITSDNSIILSMVRPYHKAFAFLDDSTDIIASTGTAVIDVDSKHSPKFIFHQFFSKRFMKYCEDKMTGTNYPAITPKDIEQFEIVIPNEKQIEIDLTEKLDLLEFNISEIKNIISISQSLQKSLINQVF